ncbi:hypothetical protein [Micromonospora craterilacus]|nr:hypothetical protein [Micromonospora craterilacus]
MHTGIAPSVWAEQDGRTIRTALELFADEQDRARRARGRDGDDGPPMSG